MHRTMTSKTSKTSRTSTRATAVALVLLGCLAPAPAFAYLDPGSGSYFFQILIAGLVGGLFALKMFWVRVSAFFGSLAARGSNSKERDKS